MNFSYIHCGKCEGNVEMAVETLEENMEQALWIAHCLFERGKTSGTTANISFRYGEAIWISRSGSCFGNLTREDFVEVGWEEGQLKKGGGSGQGLPSKELTLHRILYESSDRILAVLHTHSPYAVLWSCLPHSDQRDVIPHYTPYLDMKLGQVAEVPYAPPGTEELFERMRCAVGTERGYLLNRHGPIVGGYTLMNAFEAMEELEQSAWLAFRMLSCPEAVNLMEG